MLNVYCPGTELYEPALPIVPLTIAEKINLYLALFIDVFKVLMLSVPIFFQTLKEIFILPTKKSIHGWTALITGGAHGIGKAIATELCKEGCNVVIADIDGKAGKITAQELREKFHIKAFSYEIDVANYKQLPQLKEDIERDIGPVDILVNNAGIMPMLSLREGSNEEVNRIVAVNLNSQFYMVRIFLKEMIRRHRGHIVTISSMSALHPLPGAIIYTATKYAVTGFTQALEQELREEGSSEGIYFTTVHPYFVATRKDLMDCLNLRIPAISAEETGMQTVEALLRNSRSVVIPSHFSILLFLIKLFPNNVQNLIRDIVIRERESRLITDPQNYIISRKNDKTH